MAMKLAGKLRAAVCLTLLWSIGMAVQISPYRKSSNIASTCDPTKRWNWECRLTSPIVILELAIHPASFQSGVDQDDSTANRSANLRIGRINTYLDFPFIFLYTSTFILI